MAREREGSGLKVNNVCVWWGAFHYIWTWFENSVENRITFFFYCCFQDLFHTWEPFGYFKSLKKILQFNETTFSKRQNNNCFAKILVKNTVYFLIVGFIQLICRKSKTFVSVLASHAFQCMIMKIPCLQCMIMHDYTWYMHEIDSEKKF